MIAEQLNIKVKFIRGFGDKTRLQILEYIKDGEKTVSQIVDNVQASQSNISQHLGCLKDCGLIIGRQDGKYVYYSLRNEKVKILLSMFDEVFADVQTDVACCDRHFENVEG
ncbi:ArsR/SmtB family transcription factor [Paenibacillus beijingensis]|uniref:ArsR/SmtB family transcription factor n=1 Tax=Paenibacillus beijingensis TaxID=1126833 RepID=UPI001EE70645|nr:metalloregulator ArsR/SmtB family transcription factor [Paenibacillus beijingensis]